MGKALFSEGNRKKALRQSSRQSTQAVQPVSFVSKLHASLYKKTPTEIERIELRQAQLARKNTPLVDELGEENIPVLERHENLMGVDYGEPLLKPMRRSPGSRQKHTQQLERDPDTGREIPGAVVTSALSLEEDPIIKFDNQLSSTLTSVLTLKRLASNLLTRLSQEERTTEIDTAKHHAEEIVKILVEAVEPWMVEVSDAFGGVLNSTTEGLSQRKQPPQQQNIKTPEKSEQNQLQNQSKPDFHKMIGPTEE